MDLVIGLDFGTDSVRALLVDPASGKELNAAIAFYPRYRKGLYCDAARKQFRQHPMDYLESMEKCIIECTSELSTLQKSRLRAISVDTTGSTPVAIDKNGTPLSLLEKFSEDPAAMFILWKDHTAIDAAEEINRLARSYHTDYTLYSGGIYSSEWFWAKALHIMRSRKDLSPHIHAWVEHCDWIPFLLSGGDNADEIKRSRCAAGHKAMWHSSFGGFPENNFFSALDPILDGLVHRMSSDTYTSDTPVGKLCKVWAEKLALPDDVLVGVGSLDAHMGAVGSAIKPNTLVKIMGTSTCDILTTKVTDSEILIPGICGQVYGSVVPGLLGLEAGQSAFGDVYAWFEALFLKTFEDLLKRADDLNDEVAQKLLRQMKNTLLTSLNEKAAKVEIGSSGLTALDWLNGRRTPDANPKVRAAITGMTLGTDAETIFRAFVEATCFGSKRIVDRFIEHDVSIQGVIALGGVAKKSPLIMQVMSDVLNMPVSVLKSEQACALGSAMNAAVVAKIYPDLETAMEKMSSGFEEEYYPIPSNVNKYEQLYKKYLNLSDYVESENP